MFENSLIALDIKKQRSKRWLSLPLAVGLHLVVLVSLGFAQYWNVGNIPEPDVIVVFKAPGGSPPAPPPGERKSAPAPTHKAMEKPVPHATPVQPQTIPERQLLPVAPDPGPSETTDTPSEPDSGGGGGGKGTVPGSIGDCVGPDCGGGGSGTVHGSGDVPVDDAPILVTGAVTRPVNTYRVEPQYTETARRVRLEGTVIVQAVIDEEGRVIDVKVLKSLPMGLDKAAVDAVSRWRFQPATLRGRPVKVYYSLTVAFRVQ
jgi:TonB family protein